MNTNPTGNPIITLPPKPEEPADPRVSGEFDRFEDATRKLVQTPKPETASKGS